MPHRWSWPRRAPPVGGGRLGWRKRTGWCQRSACGRRAVLPSGRRWRKRSRSNRPLPPSERKTRGRRAASCGRRRVPCPCARGHARCTSASPAAPRPRDCDPPRGAALPPTPAAPGCGAAGSCRRRRHPLGSRVGGRRGSHGHAVPSPARPQLPVWHPRAAARVSRTPRSSNAADLRSEPGASRRPNSQPWPSSPFTVWDCVHRSKLFALPRTLWQSPVCLRALVNELLGDACPTVSLPCSRKCREGTRLGISTESKAVVRCSRFEPASENDEIYLGAVEFSNAREVRPLFEAEAFEQPEAGLVAGEGPRGQGLYAQIRSTPDSLFQQAPAYPLSSVVLLDVNADLGGPVIGGPAVPEVAEAEPAYYLSVLFGHPDRTSRRVVLVKPGQPLFDGDGLCVGRHYAARDDGVVDLHDGREILQRGVTRSHARPSIPSQS